jgi:hypothetical protein
MAIGALRVRNAHVSKMSIDELEIGVLKIRNQDGE